MCGPVGGTGTFAILRSVFTMYPITFTRRAEWRRRGSPRLIACEGTELRLVPTRFFVDVSVYIFGYGMYVHVWMYGVVAFGC